MLVDPFVVFEQGLQVGVVIRDIGIRQRARAYRGYYGGGIGRAKIGIGRFELLPWVAIVAVGKRWSEVEAFDQLEIGSHVTEERIVLLVVITGGVEPGDGVTKGEVVVDTIRILIDHRSAHRCGGTDDTADVAAAEAVGGELVRAEEGDIGEDDSPFAKGR